MIAYVILIANFSLLCSVYAKSSRAAVTLVMTGLFILYVLPLPVMKTLLNLQSRGFLSTNDSIFKCVVSYCDYCVEISVINRIHIILSTGFSESILSRQVFYNSLLGACCFIVAWLFFERCTETNPALKFRSGLKKYKRKKRKPRPGRLAISWKEFYFLSGGTNALAVKSFLYFSGIILVVGGGIFLDQHSQSAFTFAYTWKELNNAILLLMATGFVVECTVYFSRVFREERTQKMLPLLTILPLSIVRIAYEKIGGCLVAIIPVCIGMCIIVTISPDSLLTLFQFGDHSLIFLFLIQLFVFLHLLVFFSIIVRWGALAFSIGIMILIDSCAMPVLQITFLLFGATSGVTGIVLPAFYLGLLSCFILQMLIINRLNQIASEE